MDELDLGATIKGFSAGQKVFNRFTLKKILGRGGMGIVWLARDDELEREVALKFLPDIVALDRESVSELKRETRRNLDLTHPHIVRIYDFVQDAGAAAISMEFVNGSSLSAAKVDQAHHIFSFAEVTRWTAQLCEALSYAHENAMVVHRDLKPANLMIDSRSDLKVTDFGIACSITDSVSRVSKNLGSSGTPLYMSPQQMLGEKPTAADDIYSLGATLYELLTGKPPFYTGNIILQAQSKAPISMAARREELGVTGAEPIPAAWESAIAACLAKESGQRPASVASLAAMLDLRGSFTPAKRAAAKAVAAAPAPAAVATAPSPMPPVAATPRAPKGKVFWWGIAGASAGLLVAVFILGDVANRYKASGHMSRAQTALVSSDWPAALAAMRAAVLVRPTDADYRREFDETQRRWLEMAEKEIAPLRPTEAYDHIVARTAAAGALIEPHAQAFQQLLDRTTTGARQAVRQSLIAAVDLQEKREFSKAYASLNAVRDHAALTPDFAEIENGVRVAEVHAGIEAAVEAVGKNEFAAAYAALDGVKTHAGLVPEYPRVLQQVRDAEVRHELQQAQALAGQNQFGEALAALDATEKRQVLPEEVAAARAQVRQAAENFSIELLGRTIAAGNGDETQQAISNYAQFTGTTFNVTGADLVAERDLDRFLAQLEALRIRPAAGAARTHWRDLQLVVAVRKRFASTEPVKKFLAESFTQWSRQLAEAGKPALALYIDTQARREGAPIDATWAKGMNAQLAGRVGMNLELGTLAASANAGTAVQGKPVAALRTALERRIGSWLPVNGTPASPAANLRLNLQLQGPTISDQPKNERRSVRYKSGTRRVRNDRYYAIQDELEGAQERVSQTAGNLREAKAQSEQLARQAGQSGASAGMGLAVALTGGVSIAVAQNAYDEARQYVANLRSQLNQTPSTLSEDTYADEAYDYVTHNITYTAELAATPVLPDGQTLSATRWSARLTHQTVEVQGNRSRGVPVQSPSYPSEQQVDKQISEGLANQVMQVDQLLVKIADGSFRALSAQIGSRSDAIDGMDRAWALTLLWRDSGVVLPGFSSFETTVRQTLGLSGE